MSSCTLFKALGLVNTCGDELPPVPEEEPIDAGIRIAAAEEKFNKLASDVSKVHEEHNGFWDTTRSITSRDQAADRLSAAKKIITAHTAAYAGETAKEVAKSLLLTGEQLKVIGTNNTTNLVVLTSPNANFTLERDNRLSNDTGTFCIKDKKSGTKQQFGKKWDYNKYYPNYNVLYYLNNTLTFGYPIATNLAKLSVISKNPSGTIGIQLRDDGNLYFINKDGDSLGNITNLTW